MCRMAATTTKDLFDYRLERYAELHFTHKEAAVLANSVDDAGQPLDYRKVRKALKEGCGHKLAVRIFENLIDVGDDDDEIDEPKKLKTNFTSPVGNLGR